MQFNVMIIRVVRLKKGIVLIPITILIVVCFFLLFLYEPLKKEFNSTRIHSCNENTFDSKNIPSVTSYEDILSFLNGVGKYMLVIGRSGCHYCDIYKPVLEDASSKYGFQYIYIDLMSLSEDEKSALLNSDIIVPGKCRKEGVDGYLKDGFGTPLTLFIDNKTSYDCIRGYVDERYLIKFLKDILFINI